MAMLATNGLEMETESFFGVFNWNVIVLQCYGSFCYVSAVSWWTVQCVTLRGLTSGSWVFPATMKGKSAVC